MFAPADAIDSSVDNDADGGNSTFDVKEDSVTGSNGVKENSPVKENRSNRTSRNRQVKPC